MENLNMPGNDVASSDVQLEANLARVLVTGVIAAAVVVLAGGLVYLFRHGTASPDYSVFKGGSSDLRGLHGIARQVAAGRGRGLIQLGLVLLIATPVARVALSLIAFARQRDILYSIFTLVVLITLACSLAGWHF
jgi:uncharacterized membrane protein